MTTDIHKMTTADLEKLMGTTKHVVLYWLANEKIISWDAYKYAHESHSIVVKPENFFGENKDRSGYSKDCIHLVQQKAPVYDTKPILTVVKDVETLPKGGKPDKG